MYSVSRVCIFTDVCLYRINTFRKTLKKKKEEPPRKQMHHRTFKISLKLEQIHFTEITRLGQHFPTQTPTPNLLFPIASSAWVKSFDSYSSLDNFIWISYNWPSLFSSILPPSQLLYIILSPIIPLLIWKYFWIFIRLCTTVRKIISKTN